MGTLLLIIGIIYVVYKLIEEKTEPTCPPGKHVDYKAMSDDRILHNQSEKEVYRNYRRGKYFK